MEDLKYLEEQKTQLEQELSSLRLRLSKKGIDKISKYELQQKKDILENRIIFIDNQINQLGTLKEFNQILPIPFDKKIKNEIKDKIFMALDRSEISDAFELITSYEESGEIVISEKHLLSKLQNQFISDRYGAEFHQQLRTFVHIHIK